MIHLQVTTPPVGGVISVNGKQGVVQLIASDVIESISLGIDGNDGLLYIYLNGVKQGEGIEIDVSEKVSVVYELLSATSSGASKIGIGKPYIATITPSSGLTIDSVIVTMGGANITASVYNPNTKTINIPSVTSAVSITASAVVTPDTITISDVDSIFQTEVQTIVDDVNIEPTDTVQFVVLTDTHGASNGQKSQNVCRYLLKNSRANKLFWLGDISSGLWSTSEYETFREPLLNCAEKVYVTMGNHEYFSPATDADRANIYDEFLADKTGLVGDAEDFYYYFDDTQLKVRYLVINTSDGLTDKVGNTQLAWLANAVQVPTSEWGIIVFSHYPFNTLVSYEKSSASIEIRDILLTTNGTIISHICGHGHRDFRAVIDYAFYEQVLLNDSENGQAINVVTINLGTGDVDIARIGNGSDITYNYKSIPQAVYYTVTNTLSNCTTTNDATQVLDGRSYNATLNANHNYSLVSSNASVTVTIGGIDVTSTVYNSSTQTISISATDLTGNVVITATAEYLEPVTEFTSTGLVRSSSNKGSWTLTPAQFHTDMPEYLTFIMKPNWDDSTGFATGWRQGSQCRYYTKATTSGASQWTSIKTLINSDGTGLNSVAVDGQRYAYFTMTSTEESTAYATVEEQVAGGRPYTGGNILAQSVTRWTVDDSWVVPYAYSDDIIRRLPAHETT